MTRVCSWHLLAALALAGFIPTQSAIAQSGVLYLQFDQAVEVVEGDDGFTDVTLNYEVVGDAAREVRFNYFTEAPQETLRLNNVADAGIDYVPIPATTVVLAPDVRQGSLTVRVIGDRNLEQDQRFNVVVEDIVGARTPTNQDFDFLLVTILNDDEAVAQPEFIVRDDRVVVLAGATAYWEVLANDRFAGRSGTAGSFTLVGPPAHGEATVDWTPGSGRIDWATIAYTPLPGFVGPDQFRYRLCDVEGHCGEADVRVAVQPLAGLSFSSPGRSGGRAQNYLTQVAMPSARFQTSPLVAPLAHRLQVAADLTPATPWDSDEGVTWFFTALPDLPAGAPVDYRLEVHVDPDQLQDEDLDMFMGVDTDGDGRPAPGEVLCRWSKGEDDCSFVMTQDRDGMGYWILLHNRLQDVVRANVLTYEIPVGPGDGTLVATGPGRVPAGRNYELQISWNDDSLLREHRGNLRILSAPGEAPGDVPVSVFRSAGAEDYPTPLVPGIDRRFALEPGSRLDRLFFDVPDGSTRVEITGRSEADIDYYLVRELNPLNPEVTTPGTAPGEGSAAASAMGAGGDADLVLQGGALAPGRWYVVPINTTAAEAEVALSLQIDALAPVVRPGSYFNSARPGSGLFLYPAGNQLTGLWYTYRPDRLPTWYYLQGAAPAANGVWTSPIYRAAWDGENRILTAVGTATATPVGPDLFTFSYVLDGIAGSQPMGALGRGCPTLAGAPVDISSQWFDPTKVGTGYSVQMWSDYEYYAAFVYDLHGRPMFLAAEYSGFGGAEATLDLQRLTGACPTCVFEPSVRGNVGTFVRRISGGVLEAVELDAVYPDPNGPHGGSAWTSQDSVQALGGPGSTQGCAL